MMKKTVLTTIAILIATLINAQNFEWAKDMGGSYDDVGYSIAIDALGNVYTTGEFEGTSDFNPGSGTYNLTSNGETDIFVSKLDASGNFIWAKNMGGSYDDRGYSIAIDALGNVYTTGSFKYTVDFDPGSGTYNLTSNGETDIFISKLDASGNFIWAKSMGASYYDAGESIAIDALGNVYTTGEFRYTVDFDPGSGTYNLTSDIECDVFISKLDASGNFIWAKSMGASDKDFGNSIAIDALGNVYTTGSFKYTVDFDPGSGTYNLTSNGGSDIFVSKLDAGGNFIWARNMGGTNGDGDYGNSIAIDNLGNIYTTGYFIDTADFDPGAGTYNLTNGYSIHGGEGLFISKLDASGNFIWAKGMETAFGGGVGKSIAIDGSGNVYTTGAFVGTVDFNPGSGVDTLTSNVFSADIFISKLDVNGNFVWAKSVGASDWDGGYSIAIDALGNVYTTGSFKYTVDFDPGTGTSNLTSNGDEDIFILKLSQNSTAIEESVLNNNKTLLKITNVLGQPTKEKNNMPLFYIFDDGTVEKRITIE